MEIDSLRKEKVLFETMYSKLESQLFRKKHEINGIIDVANSAFQDRDQVQEKMAVLM